MVELQLQLLEISVVINSSDHIVSRLKLDHKMRLHNIKCAMCIETKKKKKENQMETFQLSEDDIATVCTLESLSDLIKYSFIVKLQT